MLSSIPIRVGISEPTGDDQCLPLTGDSKVRSTPLDLLRRFNPQLVGFGIADPRSEQVYQESDNESVDHPNAKEDKPE